MRNNFSSITRRTILCGSTLAHTPRFAALLARKGRLGTMALTVAESPFLGRLDPTPAPEPPPQVAITPCDPWPRPYYLEDGLRKVAPYHYTYNTSCKQRWRGREILEIYRDEFRDRPGEYYVCHLVLEEPASLPVF